MSKAENEEQEFNFSPNYIYISDSYLKILAFTTLIRHEFFSLYKESWKELCESVQLIIQPSNYENRSAIITNIRYRWADGEEIRNRIQDKIISNLDKNCGLIEECFEEILRSIDKNSISSAEIKRGFSSFQVIKKSLKKYESQLDCIFSTLGEDESRKVLIIRHLYDQSTALDITIKRLIYKSADINNYLVSALINIHNIA